MNTRAPITGRLSRTSTSRSRHLSGELAHVHAFESNPDRPVTREDDTDGINTRRILQPCASRGVLSRGFVVDIRVIRSGASPRVESSLPSRALRRDPARTPRARPGGCDTLRRARRPGERLDRSGRRLPRAVQGRRSGWIRRVDPCLPRRDPVGLRRVRVRREGGRRRKPGNPRGPRAVRVRGGAITLRVGNTGPPRPRAAHHAGGWVGCGARRGRAPRVQGNDAEVAHAPTVRADRYRHGVSSVVRARRVRASKG